MKNASILPASALLVILLIQLLQSAGILPPGVTVLDKLSMMPDAWFYFALFLVILLESIIYMGFYFPGQFFAVLLVVSSQPSLFDIFMMTCAMVLAATLGSVVNYGLGRKFGSKPADDPQQIPVRSVLLAMIHINALAFFMFAQGARHTSWKIVGFAGLLNLPYYLLIVTVTSIFSEEIMQMAENTIVLLSAVSIWLLVSIFIDYKNQDTIIGRIFKPKLSSS